MQLSKKNHESDHPSDLASRTTALIISNEQMKDIMKIVKSLEGSRLLINIISEIIKYEAKKERIFSNVIRNISCKFIRK